MTMQYVFGCCNLCKKNVIKCLFIPIKKMSFVDKADYTHWNSLELSTLSVWISIW